MSCLQREATRVMRLMLEVESLFRQTTDGPGLESPHAAACMLIMADMHTNGRAVIRSPHFVFQCRGPGTASIEKETVTYRGRTHATSKA